MNKCNPQRSCNVMTALMMESITKFATDIKLEREYPYTGIIIQGKTFLREDGHKVVDSHIIFFCPGCGTRLSTIIDNYAPPLVEEAQPKQSPIITF